MDKLAEILKRHVWCIIILAAILLLSVTVLSFGADVSLVSHLSLASAVVSIVLAIIVIIYMYFQDSRSSQNITEMKGLIDQASRAMTDKAVLMADKAQSMEQIMKDGMIQPLSPDSKPAIPPLEIEESLQLNVSLLSHGGTLVLYSLAKSHETSKPMSWANISMLIEAEIDYKGFKQYGFGVIQNFRAFLGKEDLTFSTEQQEVKKLPDNFIKSINNGIDKFIEKNKEHKYSNLKNGRDIIDSYFDNL